MPIREAHTPKLGSYMVKDAMDLIHAKSGIGETYDRTLLINRLPVYFRVYDLSCGMLEVSVEN